MVKTSRALLCCALLSACSPSGSDLNVQATWGKNLAELGVTPIYPPAEDMQVGDIELWVQNPCDTGVVPNRPQAKRMGAIPTENVQAALESYYSQRQNLPSTSKPTELKPAKPAPGAPAPAAAKAEITTTGSATVSLTPAGQAASSGTQTAGSSPAVQPQPSADAQHPIFPKKTANPIMRLRIAAFPDFSFSDFSSGGVGVNVPVHAVNVSAGATGQKQRFGTVSVGQVEEELLPGLPMYHLVDDFLKSPHAKYIFDREAFSINQRNLEQEIISATGCAQYSSKEAYVFFIAQVYYARTFNYNFSQSEATAANLRVALAAAAAATPATQAANAAATPAGATPAQIAADSAAGTLKAIGSSSSPGGAASLEVGSQGGLALKQSYDRPMAFGVSQPLVWPLSCVLNMVDGKSC